MGASHLCLTYPEISGDGPKLAPFAVGYDMVVERPVEHVRIGEQRFVGKRVVRT